MTLRQRFCFLAAALCSSAAVLSSVHADEGRADEVHADQGQAESPHGWQTIRLDDLPEPPSELDDVLVGGQITFLVGGERPSVVDPSRPSGAKKRVFSAETQFRLSYSFNTRCRWQWVERSQARRLRIAVRFEQLQLDARHQVWFREMPDRASFWDSPLVRHELDHVRLSSDRRLTLQFVRAVREHKEIELTGDESVPLIALATRRAANAEQSGGSILSRLSGEDAQPFLDSIVKREFDRIVQLVEIRYQELDQQTDHGQQPVPEKSPLVEWLQQSVNRTVSELPKLPRQIGVSNSSPW